MSKLELALTSTEANILDELSRDEYFYVRCGVALNLNTKPETLDTLSRDKDWRIRCYVAQNPNTKPETLDTLSRDEDFSVRYSVAQNPNCSERAYKYIMGLELIESLSKVTT